MKVLYLKISLMGTSYCYLMLHKTVKVVFFVTAAVGITLHLLCAQGETILQTLAELSGKLSIRIAVNTPQESRPQDDLRLLNQSGDTFTLRAYECMFACNIVIFSKLQGINNVDVTFK